jgi:pimeloyl-ACP methyl ester carboxylesterase
MPTLALTSADHCYHFFPSRTERPTLAFIHGWMLSHCYWQPLCEMLSPNFNCLAYDLRGFGQSALGQSRTFTTTSYARDLLELLDALHLQNVWVVGHSMGGSIALRAADLAPDRIAGAICVNSGGGIYLKEEFERFRRAGQMLVRLRSPWLTHLPGLSNFFRRDSVVHPLPQQWGQQRLQDFVAAHAIAARGALLDTTTEAEVHQLPQVVARLAQPVYFVTGRQDTIMEPKYVYHLASFHRDYASGETVVELADCGHLAMLEQTSAVASIVKTVVAREVVVPHSL